LEAKILDVEVLLEVAPDLADRRDILVDFISETRSDIADLEDALREQDFLSCVRIAHCIKGACSMVGAQELEQICRTVESLSRQGVPQDVDSVKAAFNRLAATLASILEEWENTWP
jgi:HPt (histidine-containing phosphotransfer) domain-containing protein